MVQGSLDLNWPSSSELWTLIPLGSTSSTHLGTQSRSNLLLPFTSYWNLWPTEAGSVSGIASFVLELYPCSSKMFNVHWKDAACHIFAFLHALQDHARLQFMIGYVLHICIAHFWIPQLCHRTKAAMDPSGVFIAGIHIDTKTIEAGCTKEFSWSSNHPRIETRSTILRITSGIQYRYV